MTATLPTIAEIRQAEADVAAYFGPPVEAPLPATKTSPVSAFHFTPTAPARGTVIVCQKNNIAEYAVEEFRADGGRGFRFTKPSGESYAVFIADERTADAGFAFDSCECLGFLRHGHCKHHDAARAIADRGLTFTPEAAVKQVLKNLGGAPAPKPVVMCRKCGKNPRQRDVFECVSCESRM